ncbi:MAG: teicoplanin resistance protein VanZ [Clostridiaceae bacterium]|nr:teicoplanin resistance protein VanZ [Clostridiaceae bacterium]
MKRKLALILCVLWMGFIFYNSSNNGYVSELRSHTLLNDIKSKYNEIRGKDKKVSLNYNTVENEKVKKQNTTKVKKQVSREEKLNTILRKNAHAFEYLVLAIFVAAVLFSFNLKGKSPIIYIMFICLFYAVTDEFHQMFVPGRSSLVSDVLIDFLGSIIGIGLFYLFYYKIISRNRVRKRT